ncbi:MAG: RHS repeat domain-containing protein [Verrucomicrobiales bacterium]
MLQGAGGVGGLLAVRFGDQDYYPLYDGNGNVTEYLDNAGVVVAHYEYDAFGKVAAISGSQAGDFAFQFSTKYADAESGLSYYGFRYYDAVSGRWLNRDPIAERGGWNLYGFVKNNGVGRIDLFGLSCMPDSAVLAGCSEDWALEDVEYDGASADFSAVITEITVTWSKRVRIGCKCDEGKVCGETECAKRVYTTTIGTGGGVITRSTTGNMSKPSAKSVIDAVSKVGARKLSKSLGGTLPSRELLGYVKATKPTSNSAGSWAGNAPSDCEEF